MAARHFFGSLDVTLLTVDEVRERLSLPSNDAVYRLIRFSKLPYRRVGRLYRFHPGELDAWTRRAEQVEEQDAGLAIVRRKSAG